VSAEYFPGAMCGKLSWLGSMAFDVFADFRRRVIQQIASHRRQRRRSKLIYVETQYESFDKLFIYIYVHDLPPWGQCRAGFRDTTSLEEFGDHIAGFGNVTIICESLKWCLSRQVQQIQVKAEPHRPRRPSNARIPHYGIANMGILALGKDCIRIIVDGNVQPLVCPQLSDP